MMTDRKIVINILRDALEAGESVEIAGLGTFLNAGGDSYRFAPQIQPCIFVAYVVEDLLPVRRLCRALRARGFAPWLDQTELLPGQNWPRAIQQAIDVADIFIACLSCRSLSKRGQFQSELRYALDCAGRMPLDATFLIPVRLDACTVPNRLAEQIQYVDLFPDWNHGINRLARSIQRAMRDRQPARPRLIVSKREP